MSNTPSSSMSSSDESEGTVPASFRLETINGMFDGTCGWQFEISGTRFSLGEPAGNCVSGCACKHARMPHCKHACMCARVRSCACRACICVHAHGCASARCARTCVCLHLQCVCVLSCQLGSAKLIVYICWQYLLCPRHWYKGSHGRLQEATRSRQSLSMATVQNEDLILLEYLTLCSLECSMYR